MKTNWDIHLGVGRELSEILCGSCYRYTATERVKCKENAKGRKMKRKYVNRSREKKVQFDR
jgi:hypothetical protein